MNRFSHLDTDAERLPPGMRRVGYDADTQTYHYTDDSPAGGGAHYVGAPGARYGSLRRVPGTPPDPSTFASRNPFVQPPPKYQPVAPDRSEKTQRRSAPPPPRRKNQTFEDILGPAVPDVEEEGGPSGGGLKRWNTVSKAAGSLARRAASVRARPAGRMDVEGGQGRRMGGYETVAEKETVAEQEGRRFEEKSSFPPLPPRPEGRPRRANTVTGLARGLKKGVKQMFDESESEFKARRS